MNIYVRSHMCVYIHACQGSRLMLGPFLYHSPSLTMRIHWGRNSQLNPALISTASLVSQLVPGFPVSTSPGPTVRQKCSPSICKTPRNLRSGLIPVHHALLPLSHLQPLLILYFFYTNIFIAFSVFHCVYIERLSNLTVTEIFSNTR